MDGYGRCMGRHRPMLGTTTCCREAAASPTIAAPTSRVAASMPEETASPSCPSCREAVRPGASRCPHCQARIPQGPAHGGVCPRCLEAIHPEATRCKHCKSDLVPTGGIAARDASAQKLIGRPKNLGPEARLDPCPGAIISSSPDGSGLGVWVLAYETEDSCAYSYAGGIA